MHGMEKCVFSIFSYADTYLFFGSGQFLQAIDMNQANYFEETLKVKSLLQEFSAYERTCAVGLTGFFVQAFCVPPQLFAMRVCLPQAKFAHHSWF